MKTLPISVNLEGMPVLVIGGGSQALEKIEKILPYGPALTVLSPELDPGLRALIAEHGIRYWEGRYAPEQLEGFRLVFAAVNDPAVSARIHADTRGRPLLLNAVDVPRYCDFMMPAVVQGERFSIAVSTGGEVAGFAKQLRQQLEGAVAREDELVEVLAKIRRIFKRKYDTFQDRRERLWEILNELEALEKRGASDTVDHE